MAKLCGGDEASVDVDGGFLGTLGCARKLRVGCAMVGEHAAELEVVYKSQVNLTSH